MEILWGVLILLAIGLLLGLGLAIAAKLLYVKEDERIEEVAKRLPNYNCGSCGYAGCKALAEAIVTGKEVVKLLPKLSLLAKKKTFVNVSQEKKILILNLSSNI